MSRKSFEKKEVPLRLMLVALLVLGACSASETEVPMSEAAERGKSAFALHCGACHGVGRGETGPGPSLYSLMGREAGATGFAYSDVLKSSDIVWTEETLDIFLERPREFIPGNQMVFYGLSDAALRSDLIEYISYSTAEAEG